MIRRYAEELDLQLWLNFPSPWPVAVADGKEVEAKKVKQAICKSRQPEIQSTVSEERWQRKLIKNRWDDEKECPNAYNRWSTRVPPTTVAYQGLLQQKTKSTSH